MSMIQPRSTNPDHGAHNNYRDDHLLHITPPQTPPTPTHPSPRLNLGRPQPLRARLPSETVEWQRLVKHAAEIKAMHLRNLIQVREHVTGKGVLVVRRRMRR